MSLPFAKYSGCGNDFILIDNRLPILPDPFPSETVVNLCHRHKGIGADGVVLLEKSAKADYRMRIFNADGSEAEMCGNGLRCLARFINDIGIEGSSFLIETMQVNIQVGISAGLIGVQMPAPVEIQYGLCIVVEGHPITLNFLNTGVPHAVVFVTQIENRHLSILAPRIRNHPHFHPRGTNVNFAQLIGDHTLEVRTYERGVEQETLACGTGAVAAAIAAVETLKVQSPVTIRTRSKEILTITFSGPSHSPTKLEMAGPAVKIFQGEMSLEVLGFRLNSSVLFR
jgi:diaminopimelate epimerase